MPAKSAKQYGAMAAAAHGNGTLGISPSVAREFVSKTPSTKRKRFAEILAEKQHGRKRKS